jgi:DNA-binding CsgD family transcriptional regulator
MAATLALSTNTVRGHVRTLQRKLTAPDRDGVVDRARERRFKTDDRDCAALTYQGDCS